jgi:DNA-binding beta-propeller fold protein YncE
MLNKLSNRFLFLLLITAGLASCETVSEPPVDNSVIKKPSLLVLNEGAYGASNASLDAIDVASDERSANIIQNLGDVGSDVEIINGKIYVVSSKSARMYVVDPADGATKASFNFPQPASPNAIAKINDNEAIVTNLFQSRIDIIDLSTNTIKDSIKVGQGTVDIGIMNGMAYVSAAANVVYIIDLSTKTLVDSVSVGTTPQSVIIDPTRNQVVVMSWGMWPDGTANVSIIDASTRTVKRKADVASSIQKLVAGDNKLYVIYSDKVETMDLVSGIGIPFSNKGYLAGVFDEPSNELYLGSGDYTSPGKVDVVNASTGALKRTYEAGIAPAHFAFYR